MIVRPFEARDQEAARKLILEGLGEHFAFVDESLNPDLDDILASYVSAEHAFFVADSGGEIVGTAGLLFERPAEARIVRMSVHSSWRRRGIATALLQALIEEARARSLSVIVARTEPHWAAAVAFYEQRGFSPFARDGVDVHLLLRL